MHEVQARLVVSLLRRELLPRFVARVVARGCVALRRRAQARVGVDFFAERQIVVTRHRRQTARLVKDHPRRAELIRHQPS